MRTSSMIRLAAIVAAIGALVWWARSTSPDPAVFREEPEHPASGEAASPAATAVGVAPRALVDAGWPDDVPGSRVELHWDDPVAVPARVVLRWGSEQVSLREDAPRIWGCAAPDPLPEGASFSVEVTDGVRVEIHGLERRSVRVEPWAGALRANLVGAAASDVWHVSFEPVVAGRVVAATDLPIPVQGARATARCTAHNVSGLAPDAVASLVVPIGSVWAMNASCPGWSVAPRHAQAHAPSTTTILVERPQPRIRVHAPEGSQVVLYVGDLSRPLVHAAARRATARGVDFFTLGDGEPLPVDSDARVVVAFASGSLGSFDLRTDASGNAEVFASEAVAQAPWQVDWDGGDVAAVHVLHDSVWHEALPFADVADAGHRFADCWQLLARRLSIATLDERALRCLVVAADGRVGEIDRPVAGATAVRWLPSRVAPIAADRLGAPTTEVAWQLQAEVGGQWLRLLHGRVTVGELAAMRVHDVDGLPMRLLTRAPGEKGRELLSPFR